MKILKKNPWSSIKPIKSHWRPIEKPLETMETSIQKLPWQVQPEIRQVLDAGSPRSFWVYYSSDGNLSVGIGEALPTTTSVRS